MTNPDSDIAKYTLNYFTAFTDYPEGIPGSDFFQKFLFLCSAASNEELDRLSLSYPEYVAAYKLSGSIEGFSLLRHLANPIQV